ncbi:MAG: hypothetical protein ACP5N1_02540 [Candidatus Woesearchaeota archaeon]
MEDLINSNSKKLLQLKKLKDNNRLDLGDKISSEELTELFPKICAKVDDFLGIQNIDLPSFEFYNLFKLKSENIFMQLIGASTMYNIASYLLPLFNDTNFDSTGLAYSLSEAAAFVALYNIKNRSTYDNSIKKIQLKRDVRTNLISSIAHEYTHHVQNSSMIKFNNYPIFIEGHARGVTKHIAHDYSIKEDNDAFLYKCSDFDAGEFNSVYLWMCGKLDKNLIKVY